MATVTVIPSDITNLKNDVSTLKQDVATIPGDITKLKSDVSTLKQDVAGKESTTDVDNKLKLYLKQNDLSSELNSGRYGGSFTPLTGNEKFYLFRLSTTAQSANLWLDPNAGVSQVLRSTSSSRYKSSVESVIDEYADLMLEMRPVWYRSTCESDSKDWGWYGLIAEEVGEIAPEYVHWRPLQEGEDPAIASSNGMVAEGVMYDRLTVPLIHHVKKLKAENDEMRKEIDELKAVVAALVNKPTTLD